MMYRVSPSSICCPTQSNKTIIWIPIHPQHTRTVKLHMEQYHSSHNLQCMQFNHTVGPTPTRTECRLNHRNNSNHHNHRIPPPLFPLQIRHQRTQVHSLSNFSSSSSSGYRRKNSNIHRKDIPMRHPSIILQQHNPILHHRHIRNQLILGQLLNVQYRCNRLNTRLITFLYVKSFYL